MKNKPEVLKSCCRRVLEALGDFCNQGSSEYLKKIHLVNISGEVTQLMVDTFEDAECSSSKPGRKDLSAGSRSYQKAASFDLTEQKDSSGDISPSSTRIYGWHSFSSSGSAKLDSSSDKTPKETDIGASGWSQSVQNKPSGFQEQPEPSITKKKGNLKIIEDD